MMTIPEFLPSIHYDLPTLDSGVEDSILLEKMQESLVDVGNSMQQFENPSQIVKEQQAKSPTIEAPTLHKSYLNVQLISPTIATLSDALDQCDFPSLIQERVPSSAANRESYLPKQGKQFCLDQILQFQGVQRQQAILSLYNKLNCP